MSKLKSLIVILSTFVLLAGLALPVFAVGYAPGVSKGQYVTYGNFVGAGLGVESFNDYAWLNLTVTDVSGNVVTLLSIGQFKNGTAILGNGTAEVWNVQTGTKDGLPQTQGPIIAAYLSQGDVIPPPNTYVVNQTENRVYFGFVRSVSILNVTLSTPDYNSTLTYVYDRQSGMLLEAESQITQAQPEPATSEYSYRIIATNIFDSTNPTLVPSQTLTPTPTAPTPTPSPSLSPQGLPLDFVVVVVAVAVAIVVVAAVWVILQGRKKPTR